MNNNFILQNATKLTKSQMKSVKGGADYWWCDFPDGTSAGPFTGGNCDAYCKSVYGSSAKCSNQSNTTSDDIAP